MAIPKAITDLNEDLRAARTALLAKQDDYVKRKGRYFQVLANRQKPYYQAESAADLAITEDARFTVAIDQYDGPLGKGFIVRTRATADGLAYERADQYGPEAGFEYGWRKVEQ